MKKTEVLLSINKLKKAFETLKEGAFKANSQLEKDGVIQRFEYTFEIFWKTLKILLSYLGIECYSPRSCIKEAFRQGFIEDDEIFLDMLEDRNRSSHIYEEKTAEEIFERIKEIYTEAFEKVIKNLEERLK
ncbi:MAG: nucleotidyltransferase substrate binding protein [Thermodesulfobacterium sp.]|nr:nucleotidyltransferase substrate binding protein [Thermodesulfobacterium sp.]